MRQLAKGRTRNETTQHFIVNIRVVADSHNIQQLRAQSGGDNR
jgi:hypothetical protein